MMNGKISNEEMKKQPKVVIIGSGPTGLGAAYRLQELGHSNFIMLDQASEAGGLARSDVDPEGFTWDYGGKLLCCATKRRHCQHSCRKHEEFQFTICFSLSNLPQVTSCSVIIPTLTKFST
jgi:monoamine oxidase